MKIDELIAKYEKKYKIYQAYHKERPNRITAMLMDYTYDVIFDLKNLNEAIVIKPLECSCNLGYSFCLNNKMCPKHV